MPFGLMPTPAPMRLCIMLTRSNTCMEPNMPWWNGACAPLGMQLPWHCKTVECGASKHSALARCQLRRCKAAQHWQGSEPMVRWSCGMLDATF